jgi:hydrogenase maturation protease
VNGRRILVIGVGNPYRRDDGVGPLVAEEVDRRGGHAVVSDGEPSGLLLTWEQAELVVIVDAVLCEPSTPGRIHQTTVDGLPEVHAAASSHGLGIPDAVALATALNRMPQRLVVLAVEAADVGFGVGLSPAVAAAIPEALALLDELTRPAPG